MRYGWILVAAAVAGCDSGVPVPPRNAGIRAEPPKVKVTHVLIAFKAAKDAPEKVQRTQAEAEALAKDVLARAQGGEDIQKLVDEYSTDPGGGSYVIVNHGTAAFGGQKRRVQFVPGFTKVAFSLDVGQVGLAPYDPTDAPNGYHVIKRVE
jgi:foldase protein PrsA